jgi:rSAM/selenodomain-associated transferase 1
VNRARALVVVGKAPEAGRTKTRLSPPLSPAQAADLSGAFLHDTIALATTAAWDRVSVVYPPTLDAERVLRALLPPEVHLAAQRGEGLGAALADAFRSHLEAGFSRVVLIGSDNPTLPPSLLADADRVLDAHDLVLGPSADGGYYLIGMDRPHLGVFEGITWSTSVVCQQTLARARKLGLRSATIQTWYDVDTAADLTRLQDELDGLPSSVAPATRAVLARLAAAS